MRQNDGGAGWFGSRAFKVKTYYVRKSLARKRERVPKAGEGRCLNLGKVFKTTKFRVKSGMMPLSPTPLPLTGEGLKHALQPNIYALSRASIFSIKMRVFN